MVILPDHVRPIIELTRWRTGAFCYVEHGIAVVVPYCRLPYYGEGTPFVWRTATTEQHTSDAVSR
jgi:hypothetical protein